MRGHLDHHKATCQLMHFTRCDGIYGLEGQAVQGGPIEHRFGGRADTLAQFTIEESATGFKSLAFQPHGIKQSRGSPGEGIWITKRQPGSS